VRVLYTLLAIAVLPLALVRLLVKSRRDPRYRAHLGERFGCYPTPATRGALWCHAVSVGEVHALGPLVEAILDAEPDAAILVTVTTPTGREAATSSLPRTIEVRYLPFDLPVFVERALAKVAPRVVVTVEGEVWPNLVAGATRRGCPVWVVNARMSDRALGRYLRVRRVVGPAFAQVSRFLAQGERDARNLVRLGVDPARVEVAGNLKFDRALPELSGGRDGPSLVLGCLRLGEEAVVVPAVRRLLDAFTDLEVVVVPRQIGDAERFIEAFGAAGVPAMRVTALLGEPRPGVVVYDRMGGLRDAYARATLAYVGGALVPLGGHNVAEAGAFALPVIVGPHHFNNADAVAALAEAKALEVVATSDAFYAAAHAWLSAPTQCHRAGMRARAAVQRLAGAAAVAVLAMQAAGLVEATTGAGVQSSGANGR